MAQKQRSATDISRFPEEHSDAGILQPALHEIRIESTLDAANFIETVEHEDVSASNLSDRFVEIRMDQYVHNAAGDLVWCNDIIKSVNVRFLDEKGDEISRLKRHGPTSTRLTGYAHPHTGEKICVMRTWGDNVFSLFCNLGEEMFNIYFLHYIIFEDRGEGSLRRKEIMYSPQQSEDNIVDYLLSIWKTPLPPGAANIIRAAERARGIEHLGWEHL